MKDKDYFGVMKIDINDIKNGAIFKRRNFPNELIRVEYSYLHKKIYRDKYGEIITQTKAVLLVKCKIILLSDLNFKSFEEYTIPKIIQDYENITLKDKLDILLND